MNILIINAGSSSIKYQVIKMPTETLLCKGIVERIGTNDSILSYNSAKANQQEIIPISDHKMALLKIAELLMDVKKGVINDASDIKIVGHRVVHGGN